MEKNLILEELKTCQGTGRVIEIKRVNGKSIIGTVEKVLSQIILIRSIKNFNEVSITVSEVSTISKYSKSVMDKIKSAKQYLFTKSLHV
jgi:hypothetical protein